MLAYWLWLSQRKGLGNRKKLELLSRYPNIADLYAQCDFEGEGLAYSAVLSLQDKDLTEAREILDRCDRLGISLLCACDAQYPRRLLAISDPPLVLYYKGRLPAFDRQAAIGVVGTRKASAYGLMTAEKLSREIASCGGLVVSGLAAGIDAQAAWGALHAERPTVAVLGGGVEHVYPAENRELYEQVARYGCLISEYPPGTPPSKWTFPKRNRIISGLSVAVLVVEAPEGSGTMITAEDALKQGRDLYVVPGRVDMDVCRGSNSLLQRGGMPALCGWDVVKAYASQFDLVKNQAPAQKVSAPRPVLNTPIVKKQAPAKKAPAPSPVLDTPSGDMPAFMKNISPQEQTVLDVLSGGDMTYDQIIEATGFDARTVSTRVGLLELKGLVVTLPGRRAALKGK